MVVRGRRRLHAAAGLAVTAAALVAALLVSPATAAGTCSYDSGTRTLTASINPGQTATLVVVGTALHFGEPATACGAATTTNTDLISISGNVGTAETLILDHRGGVFGPGASAEFNIPEIEIDAALGDFADTVVIYATEGADIMAPGQNGIALNNDGDVDVTLSPGILHLEAHMLGGDDYFNGRGQGGAGLHFLGPIKLWGDDGNDVLLRGSSDPDEIYGGPGNDNIQGQEGRTTSSTAGRATTRSPSATGTTTARAGPAWTPSPGRAATTSCAARTTRRTRSSAAARVRHGLHRHGPGRERRWRRRT